MKLAAIALAGACAAAACKGSGDKKSSPATGAVEESTPARNNPSALDLGSGPIRNALNLYDIGIAGSPDYETAGTVGAVRVTMSDLESHSVGVFSRIGEQLYAAEDNGYRWLVENVALTRLADAEGKPLIPFLIGEYSKLPAPAPEEIEAVLASVDLIDMPPEERQRVGVTMWRLQAWNDARRGLVLRGRDGLEFKRLTRRITDPAYADASTVVARIDGRDVTRGEVRALAGYGAELARHEYWRLAKMHFDEYATELLLENEAQHLGATVDELLAIEADKRPAAGKAQIDAYLRDNPEYATDPKGRERAADNLRRLRQIDAKRELVERLRAETKVAFALVEPEIAQFPIDVPAPRLHGDPEAPYTIVAFHSVGCDTCTRGSALLLALLSNYDGKLKLVAGDYFEPGRLGSYRGAAALQCTPPDKRDEMLSTLTLSFGTGQVAELADRADQIGVPRAAFESCLERDIPLPVIFENLETARRLGLQRNVLGLFANGIRIGELKDPNKVAEQIDNALKITTP